ncbi:FeoB-associated Cys-rich membrane protein [Desulfosporosinus sp. BICA1-9]|nr:FeoB-associated Cys-rich membrane protein [Desulfosporosinus sp.]
MINWLIGGFIVGVTAFIILRTIRRMRKGESNCCGNCTGCNCSK